MTLVERIKNLSPQERALLAERLMKREEPLPDGAAPQQLVGYVVCRPGRAIAGAALQQFLAPRLPDYMLPAQWVFLESLPLQPNGKVNRHALPEPHNELAAEKTFVAPRNDIETRLAAIWAEALRIENVGTDDNFFQQGGNSLLALQVMGRLRAAFKVDLPIKAIFENPTIAALAAVIEKASGSPASAPIRRVPRGSSGDLQAQFDSSLKP